MPLCDQLKPAYTVCIMQDSMYPHEDFFLYMKSCSFSGLRYREHLGLCAQQQNRTTSHRQRQRGQHQPGMCPCRMSAKACFFLLNSQIRQHSAAFSERGDTGQDNRHCVCVLSSTRLALTLETGCLGSLDAHAQSALQARLHCCPSGRCTHTPASPAQHINDSFWYCCEGPAALCRYD